MMATTTSSSTSVKPRQLAGDGCLRSLARMTQRRRAAKSINERSCSAHSQKQAGSANLVRVSVP